MRRPKQKLLQRDENIFISGSGLKIRPGIEKVGVPILNQKRKGACQTQPLAVSTCKNGTGLREAPVPYETANKMQTS